MYTYTPAIEHYLLACLGKNYDTKKLQAKIIYQGNVNDLDRNVVGTPISLDGKHWYMLLDDGKQSREIDISSLQIIDTKTP